LPNYVTFAITYAIFAVLSQYPSLQVAEKLLCFILLPEMMASHTIVMGIMAA